MHGGACGDRRSGARAPALQVAPVQHHRVEIGHERLLARGGHERRLVEDAVDAFATAPLGTRGEELRGLGHVAALVSEEARAFVVAHLQRREPLAQLCQ